MLEGISLGLISQIEVQNQNMLDFQNQAKKKGWPWELSKGQDNFCPVSDPIDKDIDPYSIELEMKVKF